MKMTVYCRPFTTNQVKITFLFIFLQSFFRLFLRRGVAQSGSASGLGPEGREFESLRPDHFFGIYLPLHVKCNI